MNHLFVYLNGKFVPENEAAISVFDLGFTRGLAFYEGVRVYNKRAFHLEAHAKRLISSAESARLPVSITANEIILASETLIEKNDLLDAHMKIFISAGKGGEGVALLDNPSSLIITLSPSVPLNPKLPLPIKVITTNKMRFHPICKSSFYLPAHMALVEAKNADASDALYLSSQGDILESTTGNFFGIKNRIIYAPGCDIVQGITRSTLIALASQLDLEVRSEPIHKSTSFDEAFISSSFKEILPISHIDGRKIGDAQTGLLTKKLKGALFEHLKMFAYNTQLASV